VVEVEDVAQVDVAGRGRALRRHESLPHGANVNFVARLDGRHWAIRTFERGVEGETLACGTGAVASAILISSWASTADPAKQPAAGPATQPSSRSSMDSPIELSTRSGRKLTVRLELGASGWKPSLSGEARVVYRGRMEEV
jgi:diaminopimelate epimerase